ncbi:MAG TPA: TonB-dependent receptor, partial [Polyangiaceae bacterium]|nr:TonB-dependent receptor [Polyangiaceae bacterium]
MARSLLFLAVLPFVLFARAAVAHDESELPPAGGQGPAPAIEEVQVHGTQPQSGAASESTVGQPELSLRPRSERSGDLVEAVPGLLTAQHAGGGKADQYFLRGFDADHGT